MPKQYAQKVCANGIFPLVFRQGVKDALRLRRVVNAKHLALTMGEGLICIVRSVDG